MALPSRRTALNSSKQSSSFESHMHERKARSNQVRLTPEKGVKGNDRSRYSFNAGKESSSIIPWHEPNRSQSQQC